MGGAVFLLLAGIVYFIILVSGGMKASVKKSNRQRNDNERALEEEKKVSAVFDRLDKFITTHLDTLTTKKRQLCYLDDYGHLVTTAFDREVGYFIDNVIPKDYIPANYSPEKYINGCVNIEQEYRDAAAALHQNPSPPASDSYHKLMSGIDFENMVKAMLAEFGCLVQGTPVTGDQGGDLIASYGGRKVVIQCKRSTSNVGNSAVQQVVAARHYYEADEAWVVADTQFTEGAKRLAHSSSVKLMHYDGMVVYIAGLQLSAD